jgi:hypothetical protein
MVEKSYLKVDEQTLHARLAALIHDLKLEASVTSMTDVINFL